DACELELLGIVRVMQGVVVDRGMDPEAVGRYLPDHLVGFHLDRGGEAPAQVFGFGLAGVDTPLPEGHGERYNRQGSLLNPHCSRFGIAHSETPRDNSGISARLLANQSEPKAPPQPSRSNEAGCQATRFL